MYYRLQDNFILRGWDKMNTAMVERPGNQMIALSEMNFKVLLLCDGETDFDGLALSEEETVSLQKMLEEKVIAVCSEPTPLREEQRYRRYPNRFVDSCFWSITGRCNFRCRHCFMDAPDAKLGEMSHEDAMRFIDEMAECGVLRVDITGGEPFVRQDFWELVDHMQARGIAIDMIYSNGWLLTDDVLDQFEKRRMKPRFSVSFDGLGWHDWMRGIEGAEQAALDALALCIRRGYYVNVEMCIHRGNLSVFRESICKLAEIGIPDIKCSNVATTPLWERHSEGNALTRQEFTDAMLEYIPHFFEDGMPVYLVICDTIVLHKNSTEYEVVAEKRSGTEECLDCHLCGAARYSCYISPEGRMLPCMPITACEGQIEFPRFQDVGLRSGLSDGAYMQFVDRRVRDLLAINEKCAACEHKLVCGGGCRAAALEQTGDLMGEDPTQCFLWENGYVEKIHRAADEAIARCAKKQEGECHED